MNQSVFRGSRQSRARAGQPSLLVIAISLGVVLLLAIPLAGAGVFGMHDVGRIAPLIDDLYGTNAAEAATAARSLARRGDPDLARYLIDAAAVVEAPARPAVLRALGHFSGADVNEELTSWLDHRDPDVRLAAVEAIGRRAQSQHQSVLESTLAADDDARVRQQALHGLIRIGASSDPTPLMGDLKHRDPAVRSHAASLLGEVCGLPHVGRYLDEVDGRGPWVCAQALSRQRYDLHPQVEQAVVQALYKLERAGISACPDADHPRLGQTQIRQSSDGKSNGNA